MKEAIGTFNGWRCPDCKKLVKCSNPPTGFTSTTGKCKSCGQVLWFTKAKFVKETPDEAQLRLGRIYRRMFPDDGITKEDREKKDEPNYIMKERLTVVNFFNKPILHKWLKKYAIDKDIHVAEAIVRFVALGVQTYREGAK
jgi:hypothetical protein